MAKNDSPLEEWEQRELVKHLNKSGLKFTSIPNSTWTSSWAVKNKNKAQGLNGGLCDMLVVVPGTRSIDLIPRLLFIEMKRVKGGRLSQDQKEWIEALSEVQDVIARECKGFIVAKKFIDEFAI